jgi:hypothetical protein
LSKGGRVKSTPAKALYGLIAPTLIGGNAAFSEVVSLVSTPGDSLVAVMDAEVA